MQYPTPVNRSKRDRFAQLSALIITCLLAQLVAQPVALLAAPSAIQMAAPIHEEEGTVALPAPEILGPDDGIVSTGVTHPPVGVPRLSWAPVAGAERYHVEISTTAGFSLITAFAKTYGTTYITFGALADGTYYWRVRAGIGNNDWGAYSPIRTFTKDWNDDGNFIPTLLSPPDGAERVSFTNEDFTWEPFQGAAEYLFEISADPTFSNITYQTTTIKAAHTPTKRLPNNVYYWRVTPIDNRDHYGEPSDVWSFTFNWKYPPQLLTPDDDVAVAFTPRFSWTSVEAAENYELQISTQQDFGTATTYRTTNTEYTPIDALSNDQDYYWRVKAIDEESNSSPWSITRKFSIRWNFQTEQLAPVEGVIDQSNPFFAWTPIPGVERYQLQVDDAQSYASPLMDEEFYNVTTSAIVRIEESRLYLDRDYFWRVRGIDNEGNYTPWSDDNRFRYGTTGSPSPVYPLPYFAPDSVNTPVHSDRTIAWPLFVWDAAIDYNPDTEVFSKPAYYEVTVAADVFFFDIRFQTETNGFYATPTTLHPFTDLTDGSLYYWRVRAFDESDTQMGVDQVWTTRIDRSAPERTYTESITPIFPADNYQSVEAGPLLGWSPVTGAENYRLQISKDANFNTVVEDVEPMYVNYAPWQGKRTAMPMGTYYWRVRAEAGGEVLGGWSEVRRFHVSKYLISGNPYDVYIPPYPTSILTPTTYYDPERTKMASSETENQGSYELGDLHIMLNRIDLRHNDYPEEWENLNWIFAFGVSPVVTETVRYVFYIDIDHIPNSGADVDVMGKPIVVENLYYPEYMVILDRDDNSVNPEDAMIAAWSGSAWAPPQTLKALGGDAWFANFSEEESAIQLLLPFTSIGANSTAFAGSVAVALVSTSTYAGDGIFDSVPHQENNTIADPAFVTNMLMPLYPFDTPLSNPIIHEDMPPMRWRLPYFDTIDGYQVEVARDAKFTDIVEEWEVRESSNLTWFPFLTTTFQSTDAYEDNESYYWRVRVRHERYASSASAYDYSLWSQPMRFKLGSREVGNPQLSTGNLANTTPSFWWDRVEGAAGYTIQVDDDSNFSSPIINVKTDATSYTPIDQLPDGNYYWRVAMRRSRNVIGHWTPTMSFVKKSIAPTPLSPINGQIINEQPTFKWTAVLTPTNEPRVAAPRYRIEMDEDANFGSPAGFTTQSTSFTVPGNKSFFDGTFYWRVAIIDAEGKIGTFSPAQTFYKEYLTPKPISPVENSAFTKATFFQWEPMDGAAYYEIEIDDDPLYNSPMRETTDNTVFTPIEELDEPQYYWRVRMYDADRNPGPWFGGLINVQEVILSLGNYVWIDANNNGLADEGESPVPDGVLVELLDGAGASLDKSATTINGYYLFTGLDSGEYRVRLAASNFQSGGLLANYSHSTGAGQEGDANANGDQNDNGLDSSDPAVDGIMSPKIALIEETEPTEETPTQAGNAGDDGFGTKDNFSNLTLDFGVVSPENTYSIGNFVGLDANNDGQIDLDEENKPVGVPNATLLELLKADGTATGRTTTTENGYYIFAGLSAGSYRVRLAASNFGVGGVLENYSHSTGSDQESDPNNHGDQNDNGLDEGLPSNVGITSGVIVLGDDEPMGEITAVNNVPGSDGRDTPDNHSNLTIDFAVQPADPTAVRDQFIFLPIVSR